MLAYKIGISSIGKSGVPNDLTLVKGKTYSWNTTFWLGKKVLEWISYHWYPFLAMAYPINTTRMDLEANLSKD